MRLIVGISVLTLLSGCVSARATMLGPNQYAPVPENEVRVFLNEADVPDSCSEYALIELQGEADATSRSAMIEAARRRAGKVGANGILLPEMRDPSTGTRIAGAVFGISADRRGETVAYRCTEFADDPARPG